MAVWSDEKEIGVLQEEQHLLLQHWRSWVDQHVIRPEKRDGQEDFLEADSIVVFGSCCFGQCRHLQSRSRQLSHSMEQPEQKSTKIRVRKTTDIVFGNLKWRSLTIGCCCCCCCGIGLGTSEALRSRIGSRFAALGGPELHTNIQINTRQFETQSVVLMFGSLTQ